MNYFCYWVSTLIGSEILLYFAYFFIVFLFQLSIGFVLSYLSFPSYLYTINFLYSSMRICQISCYYSSSYDCEHILFLNLLLTYFILLIFLCYSACIFTGILPFLAVPLYTSSYFFFLGSFICLVIVISPQILPLTGYFCLSELMIYERWVVL